MKKILVSFLCTVLAVQVSIAQSSGEKRFQVSVGPTFPTGDFADTKLGSVRSGFAGMGLSGGIAQYFPTKTDNLSLMWAVDLMINPYSKDAKEVIEDYGGNNQDVRFPAYINLPIRGGVEYRLNPSNDMEFFGNAGLAFNIQKRTKMTKSYTGSTTDLEITFPVATGFGAYIGAGVLLNEKTKIGIDYYMLGKHKMKPEWEQGSASGNYLTEKFGVNVIKLYVAFPLGI